MKITSQFALSIEICRRLTFASGMALSLLVIQTCYGFQAESTEQASAAATDNSNASFVGDFNVSEFVESVYLALEQHHVAAPTRQQVYLNAVRGLYGIAQKKVPADIVDQISQLDSTDKLQDLLETAIEDSEARSHDENLFSENLGNYIVGKVERRMRYITPATYRVEKQLKENRYVGIGIKLASKKGWPVIIDPFPGGAAKNAGARTGDIILSIDGESTESMSFREVIDNLRGLDGTPLTVTLRNEDEKEKRNYTMIRAEIPIDTVQGVYRDGDDNWVYSLKDRDADIALVKIDTVNASTPSELRSLAVHLDKNKFAGLIVDMSEVVDVEMHQLTIFADNFLPGISFARVVEPDTSRELKTTNEQLFDDLPIVIIAAPRVTGPLAAFFASVAELKNVNLACRGERITSDALCARLVELPNNQGAISGVVFAKCELAKANSNKTSHQGFAVGSLGNEIVLKPTMVLSQLKPAIQTTTPHTGGQDEPSGQIAQGHRNPVFSQPVQWIRKYIESKK